MVPGLFAVEIQQHIEGERGSTAKARGVTDCVYLLCLDNVLFRFQDEQDRLIKEMEREKKEMDKLRTELENAKESIVTLQVHVHIYNHNVSR